MTTTRRDFLKMSAGLAAMMGLGASAIPRLAQGLEQLAKGNAPVLWLHGQACSGCSISLLNSEDPGPAEILMHYISLKFHATLSTATGQIACKALEDTIQQGDYILVMEGSIPSGMREACTLCDKPLASIAADAARNAKAIVAVGACATYGGIPAAEGNPTGALGFGKFLEQENITKPLINIPGCPMHPQWLVGTLAHVLQLGLPKLDEQHRPVMFYDDWIHDHCPRFADYERKNFATKFGDEGCMFQVGCLGPVTKAPCPKLRWNSRVNWCVESGTVCIGCAMPEFALSKSLPFFRKTEKQLEKGI